MLPEGMLRLAWIVVATGCGRLAFDPIEDAPGDVAFGAWSAPVQIPILGTPGAKEDATGSSTKTELIFRLGAGDLYAMTRTTPDDPWGIPQALASLNTPSFEGAPRLSTSDLTLYFQSNRAGGLGLEDIYATSRASVGAAWGPVTSVGYASTAAVDKWLTVCDANRYMVVHVVAGRDTIFEGVVGSPASPVTELNTGSESSVQLMSDCLTVYFNSNRDGTSDILFAQRSTVDDAWGAPSAFVEANLSTGGEQDAWMSPDLRLFTFASDRAGTSDLYMMTR